MPDLPQPDATALAHSERLQALIRRQVEAAGGALPFDRFMAAALYAPGLGYYAAGSHKFGAGGDFVTAPELSPLFARCLARQVAQVLNELAGGEVLEFGAGSGAMAADLLAELARLDCLPARYSIIELSPDLRQRQQQLLAERVPELAPRVRWLDGVPEQPLRGVVLANEVLDAMPVKRFRKVDEGVEELHLRWPDGGPAWDWLPTDGPVSAAVTQIEAQLGQLADGYQSEYNPQLPGWLAGLSDSLAAGLVLLIDYGYSRHEYYHPQRSMGTLICHYRHQAHDDPLRFIGLQDITANVDFTAVAEAADDAGLRVAGFTTQAHFLIGAGLDEAMSDAIERGEDQLVLAQAAKQLTHPAEMGERFKLIALTRELDLPLRGFALRDLRDRL